MEVLRLEHLFFVILTSQYVSAASREPIEAKEEERNKVSIHSPAASNEVIPFAVITPTCRSISSFPITSLNHLEP
jgi:hypothetical protein